ncbi:MAG: DUF4167 domain-containing protein [Hyphomicrobiaceae bacterium]
MITKRRQRQPKRTHASHRHRAPSKSNACANWKRRRADYLQRARAACEAGDRIQAENYYQHADHYYRLIAGTAA